MPVHFPDQALQLLLLDAAWSEGLLPRFDKVGFYRDQLGIAWDYDADYSRQADPRMLAELLAIPLDADVLARITKFHWDGANEVCSAVWSQWDGEDDMFDIRDLDGIGACTGMRSLHLISGAFRSIAPLRGLRGLQELKIVALDQPLSDLGPLRELPGLKIVDLNGNYEKTSANAQVLADLQSRGVNTTARDEARARGDAQYRARQLMSASEAAAAAFREKRYQDVLKQLQPFEAELSESDRKKLGFARRQLGGA